MKKGRVITILESLYELTEYDTTAAVVLSQMLYWSEHTEDADLFFQEERERDPRLETEMRYGWFDKPAVEMVQEIMLNASEESVRRTFNKLVECGWLDRKRNQKHAYDRTYQYRPNVLNIQIDLRRLGYVLDEYPLQFDADWLAVQDAGRISFDTSSQVQRNKQPGYVYLLQCGEYYKIGVSQAPDKRIEQLATPPPFDLEQVCLIETDDMYGLETGLHNRFADKRVRGEWFQLEQADVDYIVSLSDKEGDYGKS